MVYDTNKFGNFSGGINFACKLLSNLRKGDKLLFSTKKKLKEKLI